MWTWNLENIIHIHLLTYMFAYVHACLLTYLLTFTPWLYGALRALASLIMDAHSSLWTACRRHFLTYISSGSFSKSSSHLSLGLPLLLLPYCSLSSISLTVLPWSIRTTVPINSSLFFLTSASVSRSSYFLLRLLLPLQPTVGFSLLSDFLPFRPFLTQLSPNSYSHYLYIFFHLLSPSFPWSSSVLDLHIALSILDYFLFSIFLALPPVHISFLIFSSPTYRVCSYPAHS